MYDKLIITCEMEVKTGMHIGGSDVFSAIGAVDKPVIRDPISGEPIVPGSSLKGKIRTLLVRSGAEDIEHMPKVNDDKPEIKRLFGSADPVKAARVQFSDCFVCNKKDLEDKSISLTEVKFENSINRSTSVANPRQIERVVRGVRFFVTLTYEQRNETEAAEDLKLLAKGFKLLQLDYLGGHGSRGNGRVSFDSFKVKSFTGETDCAPLEKLFSEVENYELLPL